MRLLPWIVLPALLFPAAIVRAQEMPDMWTKETQVDPSLGRPDTQWFEDAKFGLFIHWGLYSQLGNEWKGKAYYGSGEWLMNRAKIPAAEYAEVAKAFNPTAFDAAGWAEFARDAGFRYLVITAKHHEGFAMFHSKVSPFNIVDATPYKKDPLAALAEACRREGVKFGFYYSQFLDWHEPNGGGNRWDFDEAKKDVKRYYAEKSIPQIRELLSNYGSLGLVWFDMPGGLTREETVAFMSEVRKLQPNCLVSSRVGRSLGDFRDFGDSELPATVIDGPWESLFTHNNSWGFVKSDLDFKSPREIIHLLAATSARGGNLLLNVGPDGAGRIPDYSLKYLREVGRWLKANGDSIYGTRASPLPDQPWGVATLKPGRLYLHILDRPADGTIIIPGFTATGKRATVLVGSAELTMHQEGQELRVQLPPNVGDPIDTVVIVEFTGTLLRSWDNAPRLVSRQHGEFQVEAAAARLGGKAAIKSMTHSRYFGNWKHDTCAYQLRSPVDRTEWTLRFLEPGDYRVTVEYAAPAESKGREGIVQVGGQELGFETLFTLTYDSHQPIPFIRHSVGVVTIEKPGEVALSIRPKTDGTDLFWLRRVVLQPVR